MEFYRKNFMMRFKELPSRHLRYLFCALLTGLVLPSAALSLEEEDAKAADLSVKFIYTPERKNTPSSENTSSSSSLERLEIKKREQVAASETLREVPGLNIYNSGTLGEEVTISIRGTNPNQTLILFDGIKMNSIFDQKYDLGSTLTTDIGKIEVIRGPQSAMYGSEAIGGVVNIFSQEAESREKEFFFRGGNLGTFAGGFSLKDSAEGFNYNLGFTRLDSRGSGSRDHHNNTSFYANSRVKTLEKASLKLVSKYTRNHKALPYDVVFNPGAPPGLAFTEDSNRGFDSNLLFTTAIWEHSPLRLYDYSVQGGFVYEGLNLNNPPDDALSNIEFSDIDSFRITAVTQHNVKILSNYSISTGYEFSNEALSAYFADVYPPLYEKDRLEARMTHGLYFQNYFNIREFRAKIGGRYDHISRFGNVLSPRVSLGYFLKESGIDLRANYGEGFRAPTYREMFLPEIGNPDLSEERNRSVDAGIRYQFTKNVVMDIAYFHNFLKDLIVFTDNLIYENIGRAQTYGVEYFLEIAPIDVFKAKLSYTYTRALDKTVDPGEKLPFVPEHRVNVNLNLVPLKRLNVNLNVHFITEQPNIAYPLPLYDSAGQLIGETNPGYVKVDLAGTYQILSDFGILKDLEINLLINNILNSRIIDLAGLKTAGTNFLLGFKAVL